MPDPVRIEDVRRAARIEVDYLIDDEEDDYEDNRDEFEECPQVLASLRLLDRWLREAAEAEP